MQKYRWARWLGLFLMAAGAQAQTVTSQTLQIEDADTLVVELDAAQYRVQLPGIDAPEHAMNPKLQRDMQRTGLSDEKLIALGVAADAGLRSLLAGFVPYRLDFDPQARDRYGRVPGDLRAADGRSLSAALVAAGYAVPLPDASDGRLAAALATARRERRGLWGSHPQVFSAWAGLGPAPAD